MRTTTGEQNDITINVPLEGVEAKRKVAGDFLEHMSGHLKQPAVLARLSILPPGSPEALKDQAQFAFDYLGEHDPDLAPSARWVLAADTLSAAGLSDAAVIALHRVTAEFPDSLYTTSLQQLTERVTIESDRGSNFLAVGSHPSNSNVLSIDFPFLTAGAWSARTQIAEQLKLIPALRSQGYLLEGDASVARGDKPGAYRAYQEAALTSKDTIFIKGDTGSTPMPSDATASTTSQ